FGVSQLDSMKLSALKTATFGEETKVTSKKRKMKGGPNPLSCKKKKKSLAGNKEPITSENSDKPRRKRKRIKLAKHNKNVVFDKSLIQSRPPNKAGGWICAAATYGTGEAEEGRESVALRHNLATLCAHCCLVQASRRRCSFHTPQCQCQSYSTV
ncbi:hypothetical protein J6590_102285, partial [Homalodisca vitripennis]